MATFERISGQCRSPAATGFLVSLLLVTLPAGLAHAGRYHVYSCRTPAGQPAPTEGWVGSVGPESSDSELTQNSCPEGGALIASLGETSAHYSELGGPTWTYAPPSSDSMVSGTVTAAGYLHSEPEPSSGYRLWLAGAAGSFAECYPAQPCEKLGNPGIPMAAENVVAIPAQDLSGPISINADCGIGAPRTECPRGFHDPNAYAAVIYLYAADFVLEQKQGPTVSYVGGALDGSQQVAGTSDVAFTASEAGAGLYEAVFTVDGQVLQQTLLDENEGRCRNVGETTDGTMAFLYPQPCAQSLSVDLGLDTTRLSNGSHRLAVSVTDAAGNATTVLEREITVANPVPPPGPGPANGVNASTQAVLTAAWVHSRHTRLVVGYGHSETLEGRLTAPGGAAIAGAQVEVQATPAFTGAKPQAMRAAVTARDGSFAVRIPPGASSRTLLLSYRAHLGDALPAATRRLTLAVRAGVALRIAPHTSSVGHSIVFHGQLRGGFVPADGKQLVLEARSPGGRWIEFDVVRSDSHGRFSASYRFKFAGPANYQFRVLCEPESDYPFLAGASVVGHVHER